MPVADLLIKILGFLFPNAPGLRDRIGRALLRLLRLQAYWIVAFICAAWVGWHLFGNLWGSSFARDSFDWLMRKRLNVYRTDPDIVILDIDEASLKAMSEAYGRWPWPRQTLATVAQRVEAGGARAVIFDILFVDPDLSNPDSEIAFDRYVQSSRNSFYPAMRLNAQNDVQAQIQLSMLTFAQPPQSAELLKNGARTITIATPYFKSIYDGARIGTINIYPDSDNIVRWFRSYEDVGGYRIPSLPLKAAQTLGWPAPRQVRNLVNWPRAAMPYHTVSFATAHAAALAQDADFFSQFSGKVVLIGSTAPTLNDIKATPVAPLHPGLYILATVIDNLKNGRFIRVMDPKILFLIELLVLSGAAFLFTKSPNAMKVSTWMFGVPTALLGFSWIVISYSDSLIDLSAVAASVASYFIVAKLMDSTSRSFLSGTGIFAATTREQTGMLQVAVLPADMPRDRVIDLVMERDSGVKMWEPEASGLGADWLKQGYVVWRWQRTEPVSGAVPAGTLRHRLNWQDAPRPAGQINSFTLAAAIAAAAAPTLA
jgi:adenylate cyclase